MRNAVLQIILILAGAAGVGAQTPGMIDVSDIVAQEHIPDLSNWVLPKPHVATWELYDRTDQIEVAQLAALYVLEVLHPPKEQTICAALELRDKLEDPSEEFLATLEKKGYKVVPRLTYHSDQRNEFWLATDRALVIRVPWQGPIGEIQINVRLGDTGVLLRASRVLDGWLVAEPLNARAILCGLGH